jgi:hypothetical protein
MRKITTFLALVVALTACSLPSIYDRISRQLVLEKGSGQVEYYWAGWFPVGGKFSGPLNDADQKKVDGAKSECVVQLQAGHPHLAPRREIAAEQLISCMREKGWLYFVEEIVVTS